MSQKTAVSSGYDTNPPPTGGRPRVSKCFRCGGWEHCSNGAEPLPSDSLQLSLLGNVATVQGPAESPTDLDRRCTSTARERPQDQKSRGLSLVSPGANLDATDAVTLLHYSAAIDTRAAAGD